VTVDYELPAWFDEMGLAIEVLVVDLMAAECRPVRVFNPKGDDRVCVYLPQGRVQAPETDMRFEWQQSQGERYGFKLEIDFNPRWGVNYGLPQLRIKLAVKQVYREQQLAQSELIVSAVRRELQELQRLQGMAEQSLIGLQQVSGSQARCGV
jgi:hypothetical protein